MLRIIAVLVLGAILLPAAAALAADGESPVVESLAVGQADSLYLGQINAPRVDAPIVDRFRNDNGSEQ